jgi:acyl carrier protein
MSDSKDWTAEKLVGVLRELAGEDELPAHLKEGPIGAADTVTSLGLDSLGVVTVIERLEEMTGVPIPDDFIEMEDTIAGIAARLAGLGEGSA